MDWRTGDKIGWGRFGVVYDARREHHADDVPAIHAIKFLQADLVQSCQIVKRFQREIKILENLNHENVMPVVASGVNSKGVPWFVMPKARSGSLSDAIERGDTADVDWLKEIFRAALTGIAHAHEHQILHRDLKPSNILLFGGVPKISDFGIAKQLDLDGTTLTNSAQELGTLRYMAPEQLANSKQAGPPADVYSMGKILAYMLTRVLPEPLKVDIASVPAAFQFFVDKCCRSDPSERYADATAALEAFDRFIDAERIVSPPPERMRELAQVVVDAGASNEKQDALEELDLHARAHPDDQDMYRNVWIHLPKETVWGLATIFPEGFREQLRAYDSHIAERLPFNYCDTVADRYSFIFKVTKDLDVHRIILRRLIDLGYSHNRWHVREILVELLASLSGPTDVALAEEALRRNPSATAWVADEALRRPLRQPIAEALRAARRDPAAAGF